MRACALFGLLALLVEATFYYDVRVRPKAVKKEHLLQGQTHERHELLQAMLQKKFQSMLSTDQLKVNLYDFKITGDHIHLPTVILHAQLVLEHNLTRDFIVERIRQQDPSQDDVIVVPYIAPVESPIGESLFITRLQNEVATVTSCENGGVLLPNETCVCPAYFVGRTCAVQLCNHEGVANKNGECMCPPGYIGKHCETLPVLPSAASKFDISQRSFVLVIDIGTTMSRNIEFVYKTLVQLSNDAEKLSAYNDFVLLGFSKYHDEYYEVVEKANTIQELIKFVAGLNVVDGDDWQPILSTVVKALLHEGSILAKSNVFIVTDSLASDGYVFDDKEDSLSAENLLLKNTLHWQHSVHVILTDKQRPHPSVVNAFESLKRSAHRSNGEFVYLGSQKKAISNVFSLLFGAQHKANTWAVAREVTDSVLNVNLGVPRGKKLSLLTYGEVDATSSYSLLVPEATAASYKLYKIDADHSSIQFKATGPWGYRAIEATTLGAFVAFTSEDSAEATANFANKGVPSKIVARSVPDATITSGVFALNGAPLSTGITFSKRVIDSNFPLIATNPLSCSPGPVLVKVESSSASDKTVSVIPSYCFTPTPRSPNQPPDCNRHGVYHSDTKTCTCQKYYKGENCQIVDCQNLGKQNMFPGNGQPICLCETGFEGQFCEIMKCVEPVPKPNAKTRTLSVVLQRSYSQAFLNKEIKSGIQSAIYMNSKLYSQFVLTTFVKSLTENKETIEQQVFNNSVDFVESLSAINVKYTMAAEGDQGALEAVSKALSVDQSTNQQLLVFLDSKTSWDTQQAVQLKRDSLNLASELHIVVTTGYGPDGENDCVELQSLGLYTDLAKSTGGLLINQCHKNNDSVMSKFLKTFLVSTHQLQTTKRVAPEDCSGAVVPIVVSDKSNQRNVIVQTLSGTLQADLAADDGSTGHQVNVIASIGQVYILDLKNLKQTSYKLTLSNSDAVACSVRVAQESDFELIVRYSVNPSLDAPNVTATFGSPLHPVVFVSSQLQTDPEIRFKVADHGNYNEVASLRQSNCAFDYYFDRPFSCSQFGKVFQGEITVSTSDQVTIERSVLGFCQAPATPCLNGGTSDGTSCTCPSDFSGDYCETPICKNGGSAVETLCECPAGYSGQFCEITLCESWNFLATHDSQDFEFKTVSFVVQTLQPDVNSKLVDSIDLFVKGLVSSDKFKHFNLITFDDKGAQNVINTLSADKFIATFKSTLSKTPSAYTSNVVKALSGIKVAALTALYKPAVVYLFASKDTAVSDAVETLDILSEGGVQVNVILVDGDTQPDKFNNVVYYHYVSYASGGRFIHIKPSSVTDLTTKYLAKTVFENGLIDDQSWQTCTEQKEFTFPVEKRIKWFTIVARGLGVRDNIQLVDDKNVRTDLKKYQVVNDEGTFIALLPTVVTGDKKLRFTTSSNGCNVQIRASSELHTDFGFTRNSHDDYPATRPAFLSGTNHSTIITLKIGNSVYKNNKVQPTKLGLYSRAMKTGAETLLSETVIATRDAERCAHQFITPLINVPEGNYNLARSPFLIRLSGADETGRKFQRTQLYFPEKLTCANGADNDQFGYCQCPQDYTGDDCSTPRCRNGGIADLSVCNCPSGYYGKLCENLAQ